MVLASRLPKRALHRPIPIPNRNRNHCSYSQSQKHRGSVSEQMKPSLVFSHLPACMDLGFGNSNETVSFPLQCMD
jgi:hypothetical protein